MAQWSQAQYEALKEAIASGTLTVRATDGRSHTYQNVNDMWKVLREMEASKEAEQGKRRRRVMLFYQSGRGFY